jgi:hypothetical protein
MEWKEKRNVKGKGDSRHPRGLKLIHALFERTSLGTTAMNSIVEKVTI